MPASRISSPARAPSARPLSLRGTSTHPVKRFLAFHSLSPWRSRTSWWVMRRPPLVSVLGAFVDRRRDLAVERLGRVLGGGVEALVLVARRGGRDVQLDRL